MILTVDVIRTNRTDLDPVGRPEGPVHGRVVVWRSFGESVHGWDIVWEWPLQEGVLR